MDNNIQRISLNKLSDIDNNKVEGVRTPKKDIRQDVTSIPAQNTDQVVFSSEGLAAAQKAKEAAHYSKLINSVSDTDEARIEAVRAKIKNGDYFTAEVTNKTAQNIMRSMIEEG